MYATRRLCAASAVLSCGLLASTSVYAQTSAAPAAPAPEAAPPERQLGDIVVTARRRSENLQNVPISVTALTSTALAQHQIIRAEDVQYITPSLSVQGGSYNRLGAEYAIRGAPAQGTLVYRNEIPGLFISSVQGTPYTPYYDLESIQVLKGPQGTLFGGTSTGGAVLITTAKPRNDFDGYLQATFGNLGTRYVEGALNVPVVDDKVLVRVAGMIRRRDGYTHNIFDGRDLDNQNTDSVRASITLKPTETLTNTTIYEYNYRKEYQGNTLPLLCNPNGTINGGQGTGPGTWYAQCIANVALGPRKANEDLDGISGLSEHQISNVTTLELSDNLTAKNIFGYIRDATMNQNDSDGTNFVAPSEVGLSETLNPYPKYITNRTEQISEELQLQGKSFDNKLTWIVGGFYERDHDPQYNHLIASVGLPFLVDVVSRSKTSEKAIFGQATYDFSSLVRGLSLTGGIRGTWDRNSTINGTNFCQSLAQSPDEPRCTDNPANLFDPTFTDFSTTGGTVTSNSKSSAVTYNITANYKPMKGLMLYVTRSKGYRPGGVNAFAPNGFQVFKPESVENWEVGVKSEFSVGGAPVRLNVAAYTENYANLQRIASIGPTSALTVNAQKSRLRGVEFDGTVAPTRWFTLDATFAYNDDKFEKYLVNYPNFGIVDQSTAPFPLAPKVAYSVTGTFKIPTPESFGKTEFSASYSHRGQTYLAQDTFFQSELKSKPYGLLDLQLAVRSVVGSDFDLILYAKNVTNKTFINGASNYTYNPAPLPTSGIDGVFYGEPRTYGVTVRYAFGPK